MVWQWFDAIWRLHSLDHKSPHESIKIEILYANQPSFKSCGTSNLNCKQDCNWAISTIVVSFFWQCYLHILQFSKPKCSESAPSSSFLLERSYYVVHLVQLHGVSKERALQAANGAVLSPDSAPGWGGRGFYSHCTGSFSSVSGRMPPLYGDVAVRLKLDMVYSKSNRVEQPWAAVSVSPKLATKVVQYVSMPHYSLTPSDDSDQVIAAIEVVITKWAGRGERLQISRRRLVNF